MQNWKIIGFIATAIIVIAFPIYIASYYLRVTENDSVYTPEYIGKELCKDCHKKEYDLWTGSHHDLAMDVANDSTVLGNFNNSEFTFGGITSRFYKLDEKFFVYTNGPNGEMGDFEITHTFGYTPLQQYLVPFENGRYQCLPIAWDTEKNEWFSLIEATYDEIPKPSDWLYWTNNGQNWNGMCAECHSTNLQKNYNPVTNKFNTTFSEIDISCEACHGPASKHIDWAKLPETARETDSNFDLIVKTSNVNNREYVDLCAYCHSRRTSLDALNYNHSNALDLIIPRVIDHNYYSDGQILEEDYVYGSFLQSKMYDNDIKCNDCHNVHSGKRLFEGNALCTQCHLTDTYDTYDHHFHKKEGSSGKPLVTEEKTYPVGEGALCVNCHMPGRYYMGNDFRNDHSLRVPRPDLSFKIGTPNACNQCHSDNTAKWADEYITKWYGVKRKPHYGIIFAAARDRDPSVETDLIKIVKNALYLPIIRASALNYLRAYSSSEASGAIVWALNEAEPLLRYYAVNIYTISDIQTGKKDLLPLLNDPIRSIRIEAALKLSAIPKEEIPKEKNKLFETTINEYITTMEYSADFAGSRLNLGILYSNLGQREFAADQYRASIKIDSLFYPAKSNLAILLNSMGQNDEAEFLLRDLVAKNPEFNDAYYSLGLLLAEKQNYDEAVKYLNEAKQKLPDRARINYNLALILQYKGKLIEAENQFKSAINKEPTNLDFLYALADHYIKTKQLAKARSLAQEIKVKFPSSNIGDQLLQFLNNQ